MNEAKQILIKYLSAWKKKDFNLMYEYCQKTWQYNNAIKGKKWLKDIFEQWQIKNYEITKENKISEVMIDFEIQIHSKFLLKGTKKTLNKKQIITTRLIKELAPYKPDEKGGWGINPISQLRTERENAE